MPVTAKRSDHSALLQTLFLIRAGDLREERLMRQGRGWIHIPGQGHEALASIAAALEPQDLLFLYYRDRALFHARGVTPLEMAREFLGTATGSSGGRAMPMHGSYRRLGIFPPATPTGAQCLPAVGAAWGFVQRGVAGVVLCTIGDAATRQGEFYEAVTQAVQDRLPVVFVVEDNGYGISTSTVNQLPFRLGIFAAELFVRIDGRDVEAVATAGAQAVARARAGNGPAILWVELDRLTSHTNSDDHRVYRSASDLAAMKERDPVERYAARLVAQGAMTADAVDQMRTIAAVEAAAAYAEAEAEPAPLASTVEDHLVGPVDHSGYLPPFRFHEDSVTMAGALGQALREALDRFPNTLIFGEDVEDPKGGVFGFTRGLSTRFPGRVVNSPLAEATIVGAAVGLAATGFRPIFELQFIDFVAPAFNQLLTQVATLRWRSNGDWTCPAIFYAPYGAYLPAGSTWHSQSNEAIWTHLPGLRVAVPSTPEDLTALLWTALHEADPTLLLIPKHIMRVRHQAAIPIARGFGRARVVQTGEDVTVVTWGNCLEVVLEASAARMARCSIEVIDLISLVPCDWAAIEASIAKTGRLVVVSEDTRTGNFGQTIIAEMVGSQTRFNNFLSPPILVARADGHIPFNPVLEYAVLPDVSRVQAAITEVMR